MTPEQIKAIQEQNKRKKKRTNILIGVIVLAIAALFITNIDTSPSKPSGKKSLSDDNRFSAFVASQIHMRKNLKTPSTAKFATFRSSTITELGSNKFKIASYVDAQNLFGAMVRTNYVAVIQCLDNECERYNVEELTTD